MGDIADNLAVVREQIARAAERSGRNAASVRLIGVTKMVPPERIKEATEAGLVELGENKVQEAAGKFAPLGGEGSNGVGLEGKIARGSSTLHLLGNLQRNKAQLAANLFDCVQSVDRIELVQALDKSYIEHSSNHKIPVLVQVNVTGEPTKSGVRHEGLTTLAESISASRNLRGVGLMTIARFGASEAELRHTFAKLRSLLDGLHNSHSSDWTELSMGMSDDYRIAIEEGATMVRLGRALFGSRNAPDVATMIIPH